MQDLSIAVAFMAMVLLPCLVAASTGVHVGADTGVLDPAELDELESRHCHVPSQE